MDESNKKIIIEFFKSLKSEVTESDDLTTVKKIPEKVQNFLKVGETLEMNFRDNTKGVFIDSSSEIFRKIRDYLLTNPSKTLLKLDFEFPKNLKERIPLRNCSIYKIEKNHENNYFSRFTILTTFRYLSKTEQVLNEIYVHEENVVNGNLDDYNVSEGQPENASTGHLNNDYGSAKKNLKILLDEKIKEISLELDNGLNDEITRIEEHYSRILEEFNLGKSRLNNRIKGSELSGEEEKSAKLSELFKNNFSEKEFQQILEEKKKVIENEKMKFSLDIENKLINTTIIYYPVFTAFVVLEEAGFKKNLEVKFNPLTNEVTSFECDSCKSLLEEINVCHGGHICCKDCLYTCSECGKRYCKLCVEGICKSCGKMVCKKCARKCEDCNELFCKNCTRVSSLTGKEKCQNCVTYCPKCSKIVETNRMVRSSSGELVCKSCGVVRKKHFSYDSFYNS